MKTKPYLLLFVSVSLVIVSCRQQSSYEEYTETLVTYPYSDANAFPVIESKETCRPGVSESFRYLSRISADFFVRDRLTRLPSTGRFPGGVPIALRSTMPGRFKYRLYPMDVFDLEGY